MDPTLLPAIATLRGLVAQCLADKSDQGHDVATLVHLLEDTPDSYDALLAVACAASASPLRADWPYDEPTDIEEILAAADRPARLLPVDLSDVGNRVRTAFLARVAGCILGKPFEFDPSLAELRAVLEPSGEWPLQDYVTEATAAVLRSPQPQWPELVRERISHVAPDDDINYTVLAMLLLETHGRDLAADDVRKLWLRQLPIAATFGPERVQLIAMAQASLATATGAPWPATGWGAVLNPTEEECGALIRADAYGYAFPGDPVAAARLAFVDASVTHTRTGVYSTMWVAAVISLALVHAGEDRLACFSDALCVVPARSRFAAVVRESLELVADARDWLEAYARIHGRFEQYTHCRVYQEIGTLMVSARFATTVGHGLGLQVSMGNDTDSFGATAGSILGALMGPSGFDEQQWIAPFRDTIHLALATEWESSLSALAARMARLPALLRSPGRRGSEPNCG